MKHSDYKHFYKIKIKKYSIYKIISHTSLILIKKYLKNRRILFSVSELFYNNNTKGYDLLDVSSYKCDLKANIYSFCKVPSNSILKLYINNEALNYTNFLFCSCLSNINNCYLAYQNKNKTLKKEIFSCCHSNDLKLYLYDKIINYDHLLNFCADIIYDYMNDIDLYNYYYSKFLINNNILDYFIFNNLLDINKLIVNNKLYVPYNLYPIFYLLYSDKYEIISSLSENNKDNYMFNVNDIYFKDHEIKINNYYKDILINKGYSLVLFNKCNIPIMLK